MKILLDIKENSSPSENDIIVYSKKDECYKLISKKVFLAKYANKITALKKEWSTYQAETDAKIAKMAKAIKKLYE